MLTYDIRLFLIYNGTLGFEIVWCVQRFIFFILVAAVKEQILSPISLPAPIIIHFQNFVYRTLNYI